MNDLEHVDLNNCFTSTNKRSCSVKDETRFAIFFAASNDDWSGRLSFAPSKTSIGESVGRIWSVCPLDSRLDRIPKGTLTIPDLMWRPKILRRNYRVNDFITDFDFLPQVMFLWLLITITKRKDITLPCNIEFHFCSVKCKMLWYDWYLFPYKILLLFYFF